MTGLTVVHGRTVAVREVSLDAVAGSGHRADGPQRVGQVVAAVGAPGQRVAALGDGGGRRHSSRSTRPRCSRPSGAPWSGCSRSRPPTCSTSRPSTRSARPAAPRRGRSSTRWCPASPATSTRATCPRASGWPSRWRSCWPPGRPSCSSTSRPAASTTAPSACSRPRSARAGGRGPDRAGLDPRRGVHRPGRRRGRGARRGRGRLVRTRAPRGRRVAGVRAAGHQGARPAVAARRRGRGRLGRRCDEHRRARSRAAPR